MIAAIYTHPLRSMTLAVTTTVRIAGCTTTVADVIRERSEGLARAYSVAPEQAWKGARGVLDEAGAQSIEERRDESLMLTLMTLGGGGRDIAHHGQKGTPARTAALPAKPP